MKNLLSTKFIIISLSFFFYALGNTLFDLLPLHLETIAVGKRQIGFIMSFAGFGGFAVLPVLAVLVDRISLKTLLSIALGVLILSQSIYLSSISPYPGYAVPLFFRGAFLSVFMIGFMTLISRIVPGEKRMMGFSIFGIMGQLPFPLSIGIGEQLYHRFGLRAITLIAFGCFLISFGILRFFKDDRDDEAMPVRNRLRGILFIFKSTSIYPFLSSFLLLSYAFGTLQVFLPGFLFNRGINQIRLFWIAFPLTIIILRLFSAPILDRFSRKTLIIPALLLLPLVFIVFLFISNYNQLTIPAVIYGLSHGILFPVLNAAIIDRTPEGFRGLTMVTSQLNISLGLFLSANAGGYLAARCSVDFIFIFTAAVTSCGILIFAITGIKNIIQRDGG